MVHLSFIAIGPKTPRACSSASHWSEQRWAFVADCALVLRGPGLLGGDFLLDTQVLLDRGDALERVVYFSSEAANVLELLLDASSLSIFTSSRAMSSLVAMSCSILLKRSSIVSKRPPKVPTMSPSVVMIWSSFVLVVSLAIGGV